MDWVSSTGTYTLLFEHIGYYYYYYSFYNNRDGVTEKAERTVITLSEIILQYLHRVNHVVSNVWLASDQRADIRYGRPQFSSISHHYCQLALCNITWIGCSHTGQQQPAACSL